MDDVMVCLWTWPIKGHISGYFSLCCTDFDHFYPPTMSLLSIPLVYRGVVFTTFMESPFQALKRCINLQCWTCNFCPLPSITMSENMRKKHKIPMCNTFITLTVHFNLNVNKKQRFNILINRKNNFSETVHVNPATTQSLYHPCRVHEIMQMWTNEPLSRRR